MTDPTPMYAYCEPALGPTFRTFHIRRLTDAGLKPGGGIDSPPLCGRELAGGGWDIPEPVVLAQAAENAKRINPGGGADTCSKCVAVLAGEMDNDQTG